MNQLREYTIIETGNGPMISESKVLIYAILEAQLKGQGFYEICYLQDLNSGQVQAAFDYIEAHRDELMAELPALQQARREREAYYRALQEPIVQALEALPPDPVKQKMNEAIRRYRERNGHSE